MHEREKAVAQRIRGGRKQARIKAQGEHLVILAEKGPRTRRPEEEVIAETCGNPITVSRTLVEDMAVDGRPSYLLSLPSVASISFPKV